MAGWSRCALCVAALLLLPGCTFPGRPGAVGSLSTVTLLVDHDRPASASLTATLTRPVDWVGEPEPRFQLATVHRADDVTRLARTLVVLAVAGAPDPASRLAHDLLGRDRRRRSGVYAFSDVFARGQRVFVLRAAGSTALDSLAGARAETLGEDIERSVRERLRADLLGTAEGEPRATELVAAHGFLVRAPESYRTSPPVAAWPEAVELVRSGPTRVLTVFWLDGVDADAARDSSFVVGLQREVMGRLHGDTLAATIRIAPGWLGPYATLRLDGAWQNRRDVAGGPLVTHFVHDPSRQRLYGIEAQLFAPGAAKLGWMREMRALAATFRCVETG